MKKDIHPKEYRPVIFEDSSSGKRFLIASTVAATKSAKWAKADEDGSPNPLKSPGTIGKEYPFFEVEISSASHPFYTGRSTIVDTAGRVDKFKKRVAAAKPKVSKKTKK